MSKATTVRNCGCCSNNRRFFLDKRLATDNEIRGSLRTFGLKLGKVTPKTYEQRIRELVEDNEKFQDCIFPMLEVRRVLIESLDEAERLCRTAATPFDQKSSMGHLRSFLEGLHLQP